MIFSRDCTTFQFDRVIISHVPRSILHQLQSKNRFNSTTPCDFHFSRELCIGFSCENSVDFLVDISAPFRFLLAFLTFTFTLRMTARLSGEMHDGNEWRIGEFRCCLVPTHRQAMRSLRFRVCVLILISGELGNSTIGTLGIFGSVANW